MSIYNTFREQHDLFTTMVAKGSDPVNPDQLVDAERLENEHVHAVYNRIAPHFSSTRYKGWPVVERYLERQEPGSIGLDIGCGNGKYIAASKSVYLLGMDRSQELVFCARDAWRLNQIRHGDVGVGDGLEMPAPTGRFDFAISVAVVHHFATRQRRIQALRELIRVVRPGGSAFVSAWALEQTATSRRGWTAADYQDLFVPWVTRKQGNPDSHSENVEKRFYHLYRQDELVEDMRTAGGIILDSGYEKDNWWVVASPITEP
ncbi:S-adenosyl-L-methionine-dependent methyltransferase [Lipomyces oligophaga]|uniref:S-adenosyl-L-methionine-dependent methyltransferase n=1 Tax=Lipomyces oligophaga TaxID=45792 RepID=UPI0034CE9A1E